MKNILKRKQDILVGSSKLNYENRSVFDKKKFMIENMSSNKAFLNIVEKKKLNENEKNEL